MQRLVRQPALGAAAAVIGADHFYRDAHRRIFEAIRDLHLAGEPVEIRWFCCLGAGDDPEQVEHLRSEGVVPIVLGQKYLEWKAPKGAPAFEI